MCLNKIIILIFIYFCFVCISRRQKKTQVMSLVATVQYEQINFRLYDTQKYDFWLYNTEKIMYRHMS
jgi:hypothetical protein